MKHLHIIETPFLGKGNTQNGFPAESSASKRNRRKERRKEGKK
jgi:hypothetical protein